MIVLYVNNSTKEHFGTALLNGRKTIETKTKRAMKTFLNCGIGKGESFGLAWDGFVQGIVNFKGTKVYMTEEDFDMDYVLHLVLPGSRYGYDHAKGKAGIVIANPRWLRKPIKVTQKHGRVWTETD